MSTGDGGMLTTSNAEWAAKFRLLRQHGMSVPDTVRHGSPKVIFEEHPVLGYNYRMTDIQAAVGREQLKRLPGLVVERRLLVTRYRELLTDVPGLGLPEEPAWARSNWQSFCVRLPDEVPQRQLMQALLDAGVATRRGVMCAHREPAWPPGTWLCASEHPPLQRSEAAQDRTIVLPLFPGMTNEEQATVAAALRQACRELGQRSGDICSMD
jgi:dTDP-4-amino-4,6-dideoxygalactose transaminase